MNTTSSRSTRRFAAATLLFSLLDLSTAASARPTDPGCFGPPEVLDGGPACGTVWKQAGYGPAIAGPKAIQQVARELSPCPRGVERPVHHYAGPRGTLPVGE